MKEKILLVEDEKGLQMVLCDHLRSEVYFVISTDDGEPGFQKATSQPFDLMILDNVLPGIRVALLPQFLRHPQRCVPAGL